MRFSSAAICIVATVIAGCTHGSRIHYVTVNVIVPDGYLGEIQIIRDQENGVTIQPDQPPGTTVESFTYNIPDSGILRVKEYYGLGPYHWIVARYRSGTKIPLDSDAFSQDGHPPKLSRDAIVMMARAFEVNREGYFFCVGSLAEYGRSKVGP